MDDKNGNTARHVGLLPRLWSWLRGVEEAPALLPAPRAEVIPNVEGGEVNLLHKNTLREDLRIEFDLWAFSEPSPADPDVLQLFVDNHADNPVATRSWDAPVAAADLFILLPKRYLTEGVHELRYRVTVGVSGETSESAPLTFTVDTTAADLGNDRGQLIFPPEVGAGLTARYLGTHQDQLIAEMPDYYPIRVGDVLTWYWEEVLIGALPMGSKTLATADLSQPLQVVFTGDQIRAAGDGLRYVSYDIADRAGNVSGLARGVALQVSAAPVPRYWPAPQVRDSYDMPVSWTLDPMRAQSGVSVLIPANAVFYANEIVVVRWGVPGAPGYAQGVTSITGTGPWRVAFAKHVVAAAIGGAVTITYQLRDDPEQAASTPVELQVSDIPASGLPQVQSMAANAAGGRISLAALPAQGDTISLRQWPLIATGQKIKLWAQGTGSNGLPTDHWLMRELPVSATHVSSGVSTLLSKAWLASLVSNSVLHVYVQVSFDGGGRWLPFPDSGPLRVVP